MNSVHYVIISSLHTFLERYKLMLNLVTVKFEYTSRSQYYDAFHGFISSKSLPMCLLMQMWPSQAVFKFFRWTAARKNILKFSTKLESTKRMLQCQKVSLVMMTRLRRNYNNKQSERRLCQRVSCLIFICIKGYFPQKNL